METIKVKRLNDSKKGTFKKGEVYEAVCWGNLNYKVKLPNGKWKPAKKENFIELYSWTKVLPVLFIIN